MPGSSGKRRRHERKGLLNAISATRTIASIAGNVKGSGREPELIGYKK